MDRLLRGAIQITEIEDLGDTEGMALLLDRIKSGPLRQRKKAVAVLAHRRGVGIRTFAGHLSISLVSVRKYIRVFAEGGAEILFASRKRIGGRYADNEQIRRAVFALLHEPPSAIGINRTTWRMADLTTTLRRGGRLFAPRWSANYPVCGLAMAKGPQGIDFERSRIPTKSTSHPTRPRRGSRQRGVLFRR